MCYHVGMIVLMGRVDYRSSSYGPGDATNRTRSSPDDMVTFGHLQMRCVQCLLVDVCFLTHLLASESASVRDRASAPSQGPYIRQRQHLSTAISLWFTSFAVWCKLEQLDATTCLPSCKSAAKPCAAITTADARHV